jgi:hypothetical protein
MNSIKNKRALRKALAVLVVSVSVVVSTSSAYAACPAGALCFKDYETNKTGKIFGDNDYWGYFKENWNDKADYFFNNGRTHNVRLYENSFQDPHGLGICKIVLRGHTLFWFDRVSANRWTRSTGC